MVDPGDDHGNCARAGGQAPLTSGTIRGLRAFGLVVYAPRLMVPAHRGNRIKRHHDLGLMRPSHAGGRKARGSRTIWILARSRSSGSQGWILPIGGVYDRGRRTSSRGEN